MSISGIIEVQIGSIGDFRVQIYPSCYAIMQSVTSKFSLCESGYTVVIAIVHHESANYYDLGASTCGIA